MALGDISFSATNLKNGADDDKPLNPQPGDLYVALDTSIVYVCYDAGIWKHVSLIEYAIMHPELTQITKDWYFSSSSESTKTFTIPANSLILLCVGQRSGDYFICRYSLDGGNTWSNFQVIPTNTTYRDRPDSNYTIVFAPRFITSDMIVEVGSTFSGSSEKRFGASCAIQYLTLG